MAGYGNSNSGSLTNAHGNFMIAQMRKGPNLAARALVTFAAPGRAATCQFLRCAKSGAAGTLDNVNPSLNAALKGLECVFRGREDDFAELRHLPT